MKWYQVIIGLAIVLAIIKMNYLIIIAGSILSIIVAIIEVTKGNSYPTKQSNNKTKNKKVSDHFIYYFTEGRRWRD